MKIVAVSDIHGSYLQVEKTLQKENPNILIIAGDITTKGNEIEFENAITSFQKFCKIIFAVCGNMDFPSSEKILEKLNCSINSNGKIVDYIGFFGVSASPHSFLKTPYEISENEILNRIKTGYRKIQNTKIKILISHTPPFNTKVDKIFNGQNVGSKNVRQFLENNSVDICICGHIHEASGKDKINKTEIVNCGIAKKNYVVIEIKNESEFKIILNDI